MMRYPLVGSPLAGQGREGNLEGRLQGGVSDAGAYSLVLGGLVGGGGVVVVGGVHLQAGSRGRGLTVVVTGSFFTEDSCFYIYK